MSGWGGLWIMIGLFGLGDAIKYAARVLSEAVKEKK